MIANDILEIITLVANDKVVRATAVIVAIITILFGLYISPLSALILYSCYIFGYILSWFFIKHQTRAAVYFQRLHSFYRGHISTRKTLSHSCSICDDLSCKRHQQTASVTPWKYLHISRDLNLAIEHFYDRILENFILSWYEQFTEDNDFLNELRYCVRYASATVISRFLELDSADIIANKLVPCAIKHIDDYRYIQQISKLKNVRFNHVAVEYLGKRLHVAASNRKNELAYLQNLVDLLLGHLLPASYLKCRNYSIIIREILAGWVLLPLMDVLADPNILNSLVILAATYKSKRTAKVNQQIDAVEFLENYAMKESKKQSCFATNLNKIKNNMDLLYAFMQFLKKQEHVHLLQFCLDVDEFNTKLLTPDLTKPQLKELHSEVLKLYDEYLDKDSVNCIGCPIKISEDFESYIKETYSVEKLTKLSKLLYKAYDHTFNHLEKVWLPQFFHSNEFYSYICGSKIIQAGNRSSSRSLINFGSPVKDRTKKYYDSTNQGTVAKISSGLGKIKGVLKTNQPIEGSFFPLESQNVEDGTVEDMLLSECKTLFRDLSTWKVSITTYQASPSNKVIYFCVNVERFDTFSEDHKRHWVVLRKDQDFYTLKAKLIEFHGENEIHDSPLPSRKTGASIETRMSKYEEFLKKLLQKPTLTGSDLLYSFLTTEEDFSIFIATNASNIQDIGNIYQSVAYKLRKEKGQHLDSFMTAFLNSTGRARNEKLEWAELGEEFDIKNSGNKNISFPRTYRNHIFNDNFGVQYGSLKDTTNSSFNPIGFTESIFYLLKHIFKLPEVLLKMYAAVCSVANQMVDLTCRLLIERKLKSGLCQSNLAYLIRLLEDVVFNPRPSPTKEELEIRKVRAFSELERVIPPPMIKILGDHLPNGFKALLEILQNPHYNKQLAYNLVDIVLVEMYPNLGTNEDTQ